MNHAYPVASQHVPKCVELLGCANRAEQRSGNVSAPHGTSRIPRESDALACPAWRIPAKDTVAIRPGMGVPLGGNRIGME